MWQLTTEDCDVQCKEYTAVASLLMFIHLGIMMCPMHVWANGNLLLLLKTALTTVQFFNSTSLVWGFSWYWKMNIVYRRWAFFLALTNFVAWITSFLGEAVRARRGNTPLDTNQEIVMAYWLVISAPNALLSLGTLVLEVLDGELSPTGNDHHEDEEISPDDMGFGPQMDETHTSEPQKLFLVDL